MALASMMAHDDGDEAETTTTLVQTWDIAEITATVQRVKAGSGERGREAHVMKPGGGLDQVEPRLRGWQRRASPPTPRELRSSAEGTGSLSGSAGSVSLVCSVVPRGLCDGAAVARGHGDVVRHLGRSSPQADWSTRLTRW